MEIKDKNGKLLAMVVDYISNKENKYFVTDNEAELQVATFNLEKNDFYSLIRDFSEKLKHFFSCSLE